MSNVIAGQKAGDRRMPRADDDSFTGSEESSCVDARRRIGLVCRVQPFVLSRTGRLLFDPLRPADIVPATRRAGVVLDVQSRLASHAQIRTATVGVPEVGTVVCSIEDSH